MGNILIGQIGHEIMEKTKVAINDQIFDWNNNAKTFEVLVLKGVVEEEYHYYRSSSSSLSPNFVYTTFQHPVLDLHGNVSKHVPELMTYFITKCKESKKPIPQVRILIGKRSHTVND